MRSILKIFLFAVVVTLSVWALVIFYWQVIVHTPSEADFLKYLVLAPTTLFLSVMGLNKLSAFVLRARNEDGLAERHEIKQDGDAIKNGAGVDAFEWVLPLAYGKLVTLHGDEASDLASVVKEKSTQFELDPELVDSEGFPLMTARVSDLESEQTFEKFEEWFTAYTSVDVDSIHWDAEDKRALHLLVTVFSGLLGDFLSNERISRLLSDYVHNNNLSLPNVYIVTDIPSDWTPLKRTAVNDWLRSELIGQSWPEDHVFDCPIKVQELNAWQVLDGINKLTHTSPDLGIYIITAAQSYIGARAIAECESMGKLLTAQHKSGSIYGEAAAGVLAFDQRLAMYFDGLPIVNLHRAAVARRDKSADADGVIKSTTLVGVMKAALKLSKVEAEDIKMLAADTDGRVSRIAEFSSAVNEFLPEIDAEKSILKLQESCGIVGVASGLASLAYAIGQVVSAEAPALWVSTTDAFDRHALVLKFASKDPIRIG